MTQYHVALCRLADRLQTPHLPPSLAQCLQYLQFLQALQGSPPVQVDKDSPLIAPSNRGVARIASQMLCLLSIGPPEGWQLGKLYSVRCRRAIKMMKSYFSIGEGLNRRVSLANTASRLVAQLALHRRSSSPEKLPHRSWVTASCADSSYNTT